MKYSKIIETNQGFQASVNLELDLNKKEKVSGYIPTEQSVKVLGGFLHSFYYDTDTQSRANVLIGPYGRGKTHLLLVLTALTSMDVYASSEYTPKEAKAMQKKLCSKISSVDKEVGALAKAVVETGIRTLPVVINSNSRDINQSFLVALHNALSAAQLDDLLPKTYFDSAYDVVKKWENEIPEAYDRFCGELKEYKTTAENICMGLQQFNNDAYDLFCEVYPKVAAGMKFSPLMSMDVVKLYMSVVDALCEQTKYSGINIIFDEFSKFLESNLEKSQMYNMKIIQDLAEAASRSGKKQIHFTCITHKDILEYSTSDSFKTVEGRFSKIYFVASSEQSYELISNAIIKKDAYEDFVKDNATGFGNVMSLSSRVNVFREIDESSFEKKVVFGCFPLAPLTAYSLLKISELVGQNERTLFTFLANNSANTLGEFLNKNHKTLSFITVDSIFDYFEELFRKEVFNAPVHSFWAKADSAIKQLDDPAQIQIIKAVAIINMIKEDAFKAIPSHIKASILMGDEAFNHASQELQRQHIMTQRDSSEYVLLTANGVDVQMSIDNQVETKAIKVDVCQELNDCCDLGYVIPHRYANFHKRVHSALDRWTDNSIQKNVWKSDALYRKVIMEGCYPLHPITVWLLSNSSGWMQQRSTITFCAEMFEDVSDQEISNDWLPYVYPVDIIDSGVYSEMLNSEEKGLVKSQNCMLYNEIIVKIGDKLTDEESQILKAVLIARIAGFKFHDKEEAFTAFRFFTNLREEAIKPAVKNLEDRHGVIAYDNQAKTYDLIAEANGFNEFKRVFARYRTGNSAVIDDMDEDLMKELGLTDPVDTAFGQDNHISSMEWKFEKQLVSSDEIDKAFLDNAIRNVDSANDGEAYRGLLLYAYCSEDTENEINRLAALYNSLERVCESFSVNNDLLR